MDGILAHAKAATTSLEPATEKVLGDSSLKEQMKPRVGISPEQGERW